MGVNIALLVWMGIGGMTSALSGPLLLGSLWSKVSERGAYAGMLSGFCVFAVLHSEIIKLDLLENLGPNPFACAATASIVGVLMTLIGSIFFEDQ